MKSIIYHIILYYCVLLLAGCAAESDASFSPVTGKGGSMARFAIKGDYLYTVDYSKLNVFDISQANNPQYKNQVYLGNDIETIFPYQNSIFIGTQTGMQILDNSNPEQPYFLSAFAHVRSCDPVVVQGNYAYVTLRGGNRCGGASNQLDVLDISNLQNPILLKSYPMSSPYGLGIDGNSLFICDGDAGLRILNAQNPLNLVQTNHLTAINAFDVIPVNGLLLLIGKDGLYQYDYQGVLKSKIEVK